MKLSEYLKKVEKGDFHSSHSHRKHTPSKGGGNINTWTLVNSIVIAVLAVLVIILMVKVYGGDMSFGDNSTVVEKSLVPSNAASTATPTATSTSTPTSTPTPTPTSTPEFVAPPQINYNIKHKGVKYSELYLDVNKENMMSTHTESLQFTTHLQNIDTEDRTIHCEADTYRGGEVISGTHSKWPEIDPQEAKVGVIQWIMDDEEAGEKVKLESKVTCYPVGEDEATVTRMISVTLNIV